MIEYIYTDIYQVYIYFEVYDSYWYMEASLRSPPVTTKRGCQGMESTARSIRYAETFDAMSLFVVVRTLCWLYTLYVLLSPRWKGYHTAVVLLCLYLMKYEIYVTGYGLRLKCVCFPRWHPSVSWSPGFRYKSDI